MPAPRKYDREFRDRAMRMYHDRVAQGGISLIGARREIGALVGCNQATLRNWIDKEKAAPVSRAPGGGDEGLLRKMRDLEKENARLRQANEILKAASAFFAAAEPGRHGL